jgi:hypothetical protein
MKGRAPAQSCFVFGRAAASGPGTGPRPTRSRPCYGAIPTLCALFVVASTPTAGAAYLDATSAAGTGVAAQDPHRLYGRVHTAAGQVHEGYLRWDRNEAGWWDVLDGTKGLDQELLVLATGEDTEAAETRRHRSVEFLGVRISWNEPPEGPTEVGSGIRFGHIEALQVLGGDGARLTLRSGLEIELYGGSTDLGTGLRALLVEPRQGDTIELAWRDLDRVEFFPAPPDAARGAATRLYGTVEDRWGNRYRGFVAWDLDEVLSTDVLDGHEGRREHAVPFHDVAAIERLDGRTSRVTLRDGGSLELSGSNDVGQGHRGVQISDPGLGLVQVPWTAFRVVRFELSVNVEEVRNKESLAFVDGGTRLRGSLETEDGATFSGMVLWDADEAWNWEMLDGSWRGLEFDVEFGQIAVIEKRGGRRVTVTLRDGRTLDLEGSNDVNSDNKGIVVEIEDGSPVAVPWDRFRRLVLDRS